MKVSDSLQNIFKTVNETAGRPAVQKSQLPPGEKSTADAEARTQGPAQKLEIPDNFKPQVGLSAREQAFFENLFPKARKEIRAYLDQQKKTQPEKGQYIDVKG